MSTPADCPHPDFAAFADVGRIIPDGRPETLTEPAVAFRLSLRIECVVCSVLMRIVDPGIPVGLLDGRITVDGDGTELRAGLWPNDGTEPGVGLLAGFTVRHRQP